MLFQVHLKLLILGEPELIDQLILSLGLGSTGQHITPGGASPTVYVPVTTRPPAPPTAAPPLGYYISYQVNY